jgi:hypothetical protein
MMFGENIIILELLTLLISYIGFSTKDYIIFKIRDLFLDYSFFEIKPVILFSV